MAQLGANRMLGRRSSSACRDISATGGYFLILPG